MLDGRTVMRIDVNELNFLGRPAHEREGGAEEVEHEQLELAAV